MAGEDEEPHLSTEDARAGRSLNMGLPILTMSLIAIVVLFVILLVIYR